MFPFPPPTAPSKGCHREKQKPPRRRRRPKGKALLYLGVDASFTGLNSFLGTSMRLSEITQPARTGRRTKRPVKAEIEPVRLLWGRFIAPRPRAKQWRAVGAPLLTPIADLDLHPDGLATAQSKWLWEPSYVHGNQEPVRAVEVDGVLHVVDGFHRVVQAARDGKRDIMVQTIE